MEVYLHLFTVFTRGISIPTRSLIPNISSLFRLLVLPQIKGLIGLPLSINLRLVP